MAVVRRECGQLEGVSSESTEIGYCDGDGEMLTRIAHWGIISNAVRYALRDHPPQNKPPVLREPTQHSPTASAPCRSRRTPTLNMTLLHLRTRGPRTALTLMRTPLSLQPRIRLRDLGILIHRLHQVLIPKSRIQRCMLGPGALGIVRLAGIVLLLPHGHVGPLGGLGHVCEDGLRVDHAEGGGGDLVEDPACVQVA